MAEPELAHVWGYHKCGHCGSTSFEIDWEGTQAACYDCGIPYMGLVCVNLQTLRDGGAVIERQEGLVGRRLWAFLAALVVYVPAVWLVVTAGPFHQLVVGLLTAAVSGLVLASIVRDLEPTRYTVTTNRPAGRKEERYGR